MRKTIYVGFLFILFFSTSRTEEIVIPRPKSTITAYGLSIGSTVVPYYIGWGYLALQSSSNNPSTTDKNIQTIISLSGFAIGPSVGHFYTENWKRGLWGSGLRIVFGAAAYGIFAALLPYAREGNAMWVWPMIPAVFGLGVTVWEFATIPSSVRHYNEAHRKKYGNILLTPHIDPKRESYGINISYKF